MAQPVLLVTPADHLDLFQFPQGCRDRHVIRPEIDLEPEKRLIQQIIYAVAYNECYELNKFLG